MTVERAARPGETCSCGRPATVVQTIDDAGHQRDIPWCGWAYDTRSDSRRDDIERSQRDRARGLRARVADLIIQAGQLLEGD